MKQLKVTQQPDAPVPVEIIAAAIKAISDGVKVLRAGPLNERALILLITNACPQMGVRYNKEHVTQRQVKAVLEGIASLEKEYLKK